MQAFTADGKLVSIWPAPNNAPDIYQDAAGPIYVAVQVPRMRQFAP